MHRTLNSMLVKLTRGDRTKWDIYLHQAIFALNSRNHSATGFSPFYLAHGLEPRLPGDDIPAIPPGSFDFNDELDVSIYTEQELARLGQNRAAALQRLQAQALAMKQRYDAELDVSAHSFEPGDVVKLRHHDRRKLEFQWRGPFYVVEKGPNETYRLMQPDGIQLDTPINHDHLAYYSRDDPEIYYSGHTREVTNLQD